MPASRLARLATALLAAAAALALGACGEDDTPEPEGITRAEYIAQVDALCAKVQRESKPINRGLQRLVDASGSFSSRLRRAAPLLRKTYERQSAKLERFEAIEPPEADRAQVAQITRVALAALSDLRKGLPAAERGDLRNFIDTATDATGARAKAERLGTRYGFDRTCFALPVDLSGTEVPAS